MYGYSHMYVYKTGFSAGCRSIEGNTNDSYELLIEGYGRYCPDCPDDPACTEFLRDPSNKKPNSTIGACGQQPYHPGCPKILDPEGYHLVTDDPAFCKGIGDICNPGGFVTPQSAYCK